MLHLKGVKKLIFYANFKDKNFVNSYLLLTKIIW